MNPLLVRASLWLIGTAGFVGACSDDETNGTQKAKGGSAGEQAGEAGVGGSSGTGGSRGGASGTGGDAGNGGEGASDTGGTRATGGSDNGGAGSGGTATGGVSGSATGGGGVGDGGVGGEGGGGGDACDDYDPTVLAWAAKAWALAVESGYVYFTTHELDGIVARMTTEGTTLQLIATGQRYPHQVTASGDLAFWVSLGAEPGHLFQSSVTGTDRIQIATGVLNGIFSLTADESRVYLTTNINILGSVPFGGGAPTIISGGPYDSFIVDMVRQGSDLFWTNTGVSIFEPTQPGSARIFSANPEFATVSQLVTRLDYPQFQITANDENVFWSDEAAIYRTSRIGGAFATVASLPTMPPEESPIVDMVSDDEFVFFTDGKAVYRVPASGGARETVSDGWERITKLGLDEASVYFTDSRRGAVVKVAKCASAMASTANEARRASDETAPAASAPAPTGCSSTPGPHGCPEPTIAAPAPGAWGLALDSTHLYVSSFGTSGAVLRAALTGGNPEPLATGENNPHDLTVDDENVYFCLHYSGAPGRLAKVPKAGGVRELLAVGAFNYGVGRPVSDGTFVYYVTAFNGVNRVLAEGGTPTTIASGPYGSNAMDLAEDDGEIFWLNNGIWTDSTFTAKIPGSAYVARGFVSGSPNLGRVALKSGIDAPQWRLTTDATNVYFVDGTHVYRTSRTGGATVELAPIAPASGEIVDMHTDGQHIYFADVRGVYRVPMSGGSVETLTNGWTSLRSIAINGTDLYFTDFSTGAVLKRPK